MDTLDEARDRLINHLFGSGLTLAAVLSLQRVDGDVAVRLRDVVEQLDAAIDEIRHLAFADVVADVIAPPQQQLCAATDHELWAHESDGYLLAAHSGTPFARRVVRVY